MSIWKEPLPKQFYCPKNQMNLWNNSYKILGDTIQSPGGSFTYIVHSAPCCPLYWGNGKAEPDSITSAWIPKNPEEHKANPTSYSEGWHRHHGNYLAYLVSLPGSLQKWLLTVRWVLPK